MLLADALSIDMATLITAVVAFLGGGVGTHAINRRRPPPEPSEVWEKRIRREAELDASVKATAKAVQDLTKTVEMLRERTHKTSQMMTQHDMRLYQLDGKSAPIEVGVPQ